MQADEVVLSDGEASAELGHEISVCFPEFVDEVASPSQNPALAEVVALWRARFLQKH